MVNYFCKKCGKNFKQKSHFINHQNRIRPCIDDNTTLNVNNYDDKNKETDYVHQNFRVAHKKHINIIEDGDIIDEKDEKDEKNNNKIIDKHNKQFNSLHNCILCGKEFTRTSSLKRHLVNNCKKIKDDNVHKSHIDTNEEGNENKDMLVAKLSQQVENLTKIITMLKNDKNSILNLENTGTINNTNTNSNNKINNQVNNQLNGNVTTNNIKIEFGKEDLSKISNDFFIKTLLNSSGALIPSKIIEGIHFNPEFQEFMNVFISDFSRNKAMIYDGKTWNIANADEIVNTLFDKAIIFCEDRNEELYDKIQKNDKIKKKINKEMHVMDIMNNNEPYEYNEHKEPVDIDGNVLVLSELKRGKCLNGKAKEHLKKSLYNKKTVVVK